jgi:hypothetical protein
LNFGLFYLFLTLMKDVLKTLMMLFILGSPIAVVFFLKFFGSNKFDLPVYHQSGFEWEIKGCDNMPPPHIVSYPILLDNNLSNKKAMIIGSFQNDRTTTNNLLRIKHVIDSTQTQMMVLHDLDIVLPENQPDLNFVGLEPDLLTKFINCQLLLRTPDEFVLIDDNKKIRGYYNLSNQEEVERLIVEIKILLYE